MFGINEYLNDEYICQSEHENLVIFNYSRECQYDNKWNDLRKSARGIIFDRTTGSLVAVPLRKFFNLDEVDETKISNLPSGNFLVLEKYDGSLGILYKNKGQYKIATKGSFTSEQAIWATNWIQSNIKLSIVNDAYTFLFEIIYKGNRIVVPYSEEECVLISVVDKISGKELPFDKIEEWGLLLGCKTPVSYSFNSICDIVSLCRDLPSTKEGFVVTFSNGLKVKIKGADYVRIHKMISRMTPLAFWEAWDIDLKDIPKEYRAQLPEEFRDVSDALYHQIYVMHWSPLNRIAQLHADIEILLGKGADKKTWALKTKELYPREFSGIMDLHNGKTHQMLRGIHQQCRPTQNILPKGIAGSDRIQRILQDS